MLCCIPKRKKTIHTATSPLNNDYSKLEDSFSEIIQQIDNNYNTFNCIKCNNEYSEYYKNGILQKETEFNDLFKEHNKLEIEYDNLKNSLKEKNDYINNLEDRFSFEINNIINQKSCNLNSGCKHDDCDISYYKKKIFDLEKQINFYKIDYDNLLQNNLNLKKYTEDANKLHFFQTTVIKDYEIKLTNINSTLENLTKLNNKLKNLNMVLNEKNKNLIKENTSNISDNEYLNQSNKRLKERLSNK